MSAAKERSYGPIVYGFTLWGHKGDRPAMLGQNEKRIATTFSRIHVVQSEVRRTVQASMYLLFGRCQSWDRPQARLPHWKARFQAQAITVDRHSRLSENTVDQVIAAVRLVTDAYPDIVLHRAAWISARMDRATALRILAKAKRDGVKFETSVVRTIRRDVGALPNPMMDTACEECGSRWQGCTLNERA